MARMVDLGGIFVWGAARSANEYASLAEERRQLEAVNLKCASTSDIRRALNAFAGGYATRRIRGAPRTSFRCGRSTDPENLWRHVRDLWAPPPAVVRLGRFNEPRRPVLYFSGDPATALIETRPQPMEFRTILVMKPRVEDPRMPFVQLALERLPRSPAYLKGFGSILQGLAQEPVLVEYLERAGIRDFWRSQNEFLTQVCSRPYAADEEGDYYRLTSLIGEQLQKVDDVRGIFYPSVANDYRGTNVAMPIRYGTAAMKPVEAWLVALTDRIDPFGIFDSARVIRRAAIDDAGQLSWGGNMSATLHNLHLEVAPIQGQRWPS